MKEEQRQNMSVYNATPSRYDAKYKESFEKYGKPDAERFVSMLNGSKILDVGCGPGHFLEFFREKELDALGIDLSDGFIELCSSKGLNVRKMDLEEPLLYPYSFDGIFANMSLLHLPRERVQRAVDKLARLLKPNGLFFVAVKEGTKQGMEVDDENPPHQRWMTYFTDEEMKSFFAKKFDGVWEKKFVLPSGNVHLKYLFRLKPVSK